MKNIAIIYATKTNHSKKIAEAIGKNFGIEAINITENPTLENIDCLFIVGGIYRGVSSPKLREYVEKIPKDAIKKAALITSCLSKRQKQEDIKHILMSKGIEVIDECICRGGLFLFYMRHPNDIDLIQAIDFANNIIGSIN